MVNHDITFIRPEYQRASALWAKVRDVCRGPQEIHSKGKRYLPEPDPDNPQRNEEYRKRAVFYAITGHTENGLIGLAFRRSPTVTAIDKLAYLKTHVDGSGTSIYQQSQSVLGSVLETGRHGLYVDYNSDTKQAVILSYRAEDIINWRTARINGRHQLVLIVLRECIEEPQGYGFNDVIQYRELTLEDGRFICRVWRQSADSGPYVVDAEYTPSPLGGGYWAEIPFMFVGAQNNDATIDESPLLPLAELNLGHYRNSADYEDSLFFCGQVQPYLSGLDTEWRDHLQQQGLVLGSRSPILLPVNGTYGYAQAQPNMLAKEGMDSKRDYMVALGARLIEPNRAIKTATQAEGEQIAATSVLGICCANISQAYTQTMKWCAYYLGVKDAEVGYQISQEFISKVMDAGLMSSMVAAWQSGAMRDSDLVRLLQKFDVIDPSDDPFDVIDELHNRPPLMKDKTDDHSQPASER